MKSANQFVKLIFLLISVARISAEQRNIYDPSNGVSTTRSSNSKTNKTNGRTSNNSMSSTTIRSSTTIGNSTTIRNSTTISTGKSTSNETQTAPKTNSTATSLAKNDTNSNTNWINICVIVGATGFLSLLLVFILLVKKFRRKAEAIRVTAELRRVSAVSFRPRPSVLSASIAIPITSPTRPTSSPVYCEADIFQFPSGSESRSETANTEVEASTDSDDEYSYPDAYETMNGQDPLQASGVYSYAYDHIIVNTDYVNVSPRVRSTNDTKGKDDLEYEYVQKSRNSTEHDEEDDYGYAYDHRSTFNACFVGARTPSASAQEYTYKDDADGGDIYENFPAVLSLENKTDPLEYINVL